MTTDIQTMGNESGLTKGQLRELRAALLAKRKELNDSIALRKGRDTSIEANDRHAEEIDQACTNQLQAVALSVLDSESRLLTQVEMALRKLEFGEYGLCEGTGEPIGYPRLRVIPWAPFSVMYKEAEERRTRDLMR